MATVATVIGIHGVRFFLGAGSGMTEFSGS
jgi:hypothetical protein